MCKIANPIYLHCILQTFKPVVNGMERDYFPEDTDGFQYLTSTGQIQVELLLDNFRDFIARAGFRILQSSWNKCLYVIEYKNLSSDGSTT